MTLSRALLASVLIAAVSLCMSSTTSAATPPDSCFAFDSGTGTITDYYDHESNNSANPACPRDVDIPSTIGGVPVVTIGSSSFSNNELTAVTIPSSVTTIGTFAFRVNYLSSVEIPASVESIGNYALSSNRLTDVTILDDPTTIGSDILNQNPVESISYDGVTYDDTQPLPESCFAFSAGTITSFRYANLGHIKSNAQACLNPEVTIPSQIGGVPVTAIGTNAFARTNIESVEIPEGVETIGNRAFFHNQLTTVTLPAGLTTVGWFAFYSNKIETVYAPDSLVSLEYNAFFLQNEWGGYVQWEAMEGVPYVWTSDPSELQQLYDSIWYVRIYTDNTSNPGGLQNAIIPENWEMGYDANANGENDSLGGHIINPASVTLNYINQLNSELSSNQTFVGNLADNYLNNYQVSNLPESPSIVDAANPTLAEQAAIDEALSVYYRIGDSVTIDPPAISGYITPEPQTFVLGAADNTFSYVYAQVPGSSGSGSTAGSSDSSGTTPDEQLADTGVSSFLALLYALGMVVSGTVLWRLNKTAGDYRR